MPEDELAAALSVEAATRAAERIMGQISDYFPLLLLTLPLTGHFASALTNFRGASRPVRQHLLRSGFFREIMDGLNGPRMLELAAGSADVPDPVATFYGAQDANAASLAALAAIHPIRAAPIVVVAPEPAPPPPEINMPVGQGFDIEVDEEMAAAAAGGDEIVVEQLPIGSPISSADSDVDLLDDVDDDAYDMAMNPMNWAA